MRPERPFTVMHFAHLTFTRPLDGSTHLYFSTQVPKPEHAKADRTKRNKKLYTECVLTDPFL